MEFGLMFSFAFAQELCYNSLLDILKARGVMFMDELHSRLTDMARRIGSILERL